MILQIISCYLVTNDFIFYFLNIYDMKYIPNCPQSFTGKERDSETGLSYFGARYYDSDLMTGWLSVDPMADKYPNISPYAYCAWNPVKLVDPDGRMVDEWEYDKNTKKLDWISDKGGDNHQTVYLKETNKSTEVVEFDGYIGEMFDFSIVSPKVDALLEGAGKVVDGFKLAVAGITIGAASLGSASLIGVPIALAGGGVMGSGFCDIAETLFNGTTNNKSFSVQEKIKGLCDESAKIAIGSYAHKWKFEKIVTTGITSLFVSDIKSYNAKHPNFIGYPSNSKRRYIQ